MKTIAIFDKRAKRCPLVWPMYHHLMHYFNVIYIDNEGLDRPAQVGIMRGLMGLGLSQVDAILWGFMEGSALDKSKDWINSMGIPVIVSVSDFKQFYTMPAKTMQFWGLETVKGILYKQRLDNPEDMYLSEIRNFQERGWIPDDMTRERYGDGPKNFLKRAKILFSPWAVNPAKLLPVNQKTKEIGAIQVCTITPGEPMHKQRWDMHEALQGVPEAITQMNLPYPDYLSRLHQAKIAVVDNCGTGVTTQKYIEAAMNGCLLIGELPELDNEIFSDGETMIRSEPDDLPGFIEYYLAHDDERIAIAEELRRRVALAYSLDASIYDIVKEYDPESFEKDHKEGVV
jgi:hypothetical protein